MKNNDYKIGDKIYCIKSHKEEECDSRLVKDKYYTISDMIYDLNDFNKVITIYVEEIKSPRYGFMPSRFLTTTELRSLKIDKIRNGK